MDSSSVSINLPSTKTMQVFYIIFLFMMSRLYYVTPKCIECMQSGACFPPACFCCRGEMGLSFPISDSPQIVFFSFDDALTKVASKFYDRLFSKNNKNPNGCPISMTMFISHQDTDYSRVSDFHRRGMEIAAHSVTHKHMNNRNFMNEARDQKQNLARLAKINEREIVGWRSPFLEPVGDLQPEVLGKLGYLYDATLTYSKRKLNETATMPFTLDFGWPYDCKVKPCPKKRHRGFWEVPVVSLLDYKHKYDCVYVDGCMNIPPDENTAYQFLMDNFNSYYHGEKLPFGINMHPSWFYNDERLNAMDRFIKELSRRDDVFIVSIKKMIDWLKHPTPLSKMSTFSSWQCPESLNRLRPNTASRFRNYKNLKNKKQSLPRSIHLSRSSQPPPPVFPELRQSPLAKTSRDFKEIIFPISSRRDIFSGQTHKRNQQKPEIQKRGQNKLHMQELQKKQTGTQQDNQRNRHEQRQHHQSLQIENNQHKNEQRRISQPITTRRPFMFGRMHIPQPTLHRFSKVSNYFNGQKLTDRNSVQNRNEKPISNKRLSKPPLISYQHINSILQQSHNTNSRKLHTSQTLRKTPITLESSNRFPQLRSFHTKAHQHNNWLHKPYIPHQQEFKETPTNKTMTPKPPKQFSFIRAGTSFRKGSHFAPKTYHTSDMISKQIMKDAKPTVQPVSKERKQPFTALWRTDVKHKIEESPSWQSEILSRGRRTQAPLTLDKNETPDSNKKQPNAISELEKRRTMMTGKLSQEHVSKNVWAIHVVDDARVTTTRPPQYTSMTTNLDIPLEKHAIKSTFSSGHHSKSFPISNSWLNNALQNKREISLITPNKPINVELWKPKLNQSKKVRIGVFSNTMQPDNTWNVPVLKKTGKVYNMNLTSIYNETKPTDIKQKSFGQDKKFQDVQEKAFTTRDFTQNSLQTTFKTKIKKVISEQKVNTDEKQTSHVPARQSKDFDSLFDALLQLIVHTSK